MLRGKLIKLGMIVYIFMTIQTGVALAGNFERISVSSTGEQGNESSNDYAPMTPDGRFVVFESDASNLVPNDTNNNTDVFLKDRLTGKIELISVGLNGESANNYSDDPAISADGRFIAFSSRATDLVEGGNTYEHSEIFLRDRLMGTTTLISKSNIGEQGNGYSSDPSISEDGRYITYWSDSNNLIDGLNHPDWMDGNAYLYDRIAGETTLISKDLEGNYASSGYPRISGDGKFIVFSSTESKIVENDHNGYDDFFVYERETGKIELISKSTAGVQGNSYISMRASISRDGTKIAFLSEADNLVEGDTNGLIDLFVHNRLTGETQRVGISTDKQVIYTSGISGNGKYVAFTTLDNYQDPNVEGYEAPDVYIVDLEKQSTEKLGIAFSGLEHSTFIYHPTMNYDGNYLTFEASASKIVANDTNDVSDIFLYERLQKQSPSPTNLKYLGPLAAKRNSTINFSIKLTSEGQGVNLSGKKVTFKLGNQTITSLTNSEGIADGVLTLEQDFGVYPLEIKFAGDEQLLGSDFKGDFSITAGYSGKVPPGKK